MNLKLKPQQAKKPYAFDKILDPSYEEIERIQCPKCLRSFRSTAFELCHNKDGICKRVFLSRRPQFNSSKQRLSMIYDTSSQNDFSPGKNNQGIINIRKPLNSEWRSKCIGWRKIVKRDSKLQISSKPFIIVTSKQVQQATVSKS